MSAPIRVSASRLKTFKEWPATAHYKTVNGCLSSVYLGTMWIYLVTCLVNGKHYVGRTVRANPNRRWNEHKSAARRGKKIGVICRAIRKHGESAFTFTPIEKVVRLEDMPEREAFWIASYDCLAPKGYNLETYQPTRVLSEASRKRQSCAQQGVKKLHNATSRYVGVHKRNHQWVALLTYRTVDYWYAFSSEREAALAYDKVALHLFGKRAKINLPEVTSSAQEREEMHSLFIENKHSSGYWGVHRSLTIGKWKASVHLADGGSRVRITDSEVEAAQFVDVVKVVCCGAQREELNFPERYEQYKGLTEAWLDSKAYVTSNRGVTKRGNRYRCRLGPGGSLWTGSFITHEEATQAIDAKRRELGMTWNL